MNKGAYQGSFSLYYIPSFTDSPRRSCNSPSIFYSASPSRKTYPPNNPASFHRRIRDISPRPDTISPARQNVSRNLRICIVIKASFATLRSFSPLLYLRARFFATLFAHKIAFPSKKLSKNPLTSSPTFSKLPISAPASTVRKAHVS